MELFTHAVGASRVLLLLPGAQMHPAHVREAGLAQALAEAGAPLDLCVPDLHLDPTGQVDASRLLQEQVLPALRARYAELWLGGVSLGGLLALRHAQRAPEGLRGLCLLSPYAGSRLTANAIARAGGLRAWQATPAQQQDPEFALWLGLRQGCPALPTFIGWGTADRFAPAIETLAQCLRSAHTTQVPHGHDWRSWLPLAQAFVRWLDTGSPGAAVT